QLFGGMVGYAVAWGVRRAMFAAVPGLGEGTFAAAAARVTHPGAKLAKDAGAKIHGIMVNMDSQVQNDADKIKSCKNLDEASAQWLKDCNEKEEATDKALVASNHAFWGPSRNAA
ncbi:alanine:cation symporter family protein, partial [Salinifilum aidingensis]